MNSWIEKASINELIGLMNVPIFDNSFAAEEYVKRIKNSEKTKRIDLILELIKKCYTNSHTIFKMWIVYIMVKLLNDEMVIESSSKFSGIQTEFNNLI